MIKSISKALGRPGFTLMYIIFTPVYSFLLTFGALLKALHFDLVAFLLGSILNSSTSFGSSDAVSVQSKLCRDYFQSGKINSVNELHDKVDPTVSVVNSTLDGLNKISWKVFVRWPDQERPPEPWYIERNTEILKSLDKKILRQEIKSKDDFATLLQDQHRIMVQGYEGTPVYLGTRGIIHDWNPLVNDKWNDWRQTERYKSTYGDAPNIGEWRRSMTEVHLFLFNNSSFPNPFRIAENEIQTFLLTEKSDFGYSMVDVDFRGVNFYKKRENSGLIGAYRPSKTISPESGKYFTGNPLLIPEFLQVAYGQFKELEHTNYQSQEFHELLPKYFQTLCAARFFDEVNNSIYMAHVNYFLIRHGYKPVPHSNLDIIAMMYTSTKDQTEEEKSLLSHRYVDLFWRKIKELQSL